MSVHGKQPGFFARPKQKGITLVELVILIVLIGVIAVPFSNAFLATSKSFLLDADITQGGSLARECAEFILHRRRNGDIHAGAQATGTDCNDPVIPGFSAPQETITITPYIAGNGNCPVGSGGCANIKIEVRDTSAATVRNALYLYLIY